MLGDAVCSFKPVYGQGMTAAALQVKALQQVLADRVAQKQGIEEIAFSFFSRAAEVLTTPWLLVAIFDFSYPQTDAQLPDLKKRVQYR